MVMDSKISELEHFESCLACIFQRVLHAHLWVSYCPYNTVDLRFIYKIDICLTDNVCYLGKLDYEKSHPVTRARIKVKKKYLGLTQDSFKSRHSGHKTSFKHPKYKNATRLSTAIWALKESDPPIPFNLKFSILKLARAYTTLNLRSELMNKCRHRRKHLLFNWR